MKRYIQPTVSVESAALRLVTGIVSSGGASVPVSSNGSVPTSGYMVGGIYSEEVKATSLAIWQVTTFVERGLKVARDLYGEGSAAYLGSWLDAETGQVWFDVSEHVAERGAALRLAAKRGELAVYDIATGESVYIGASDVSSHSDLMMASL